VADSRGSPWSVKLPLEMGGFEASGSLWASLPTHTIGQELSSNQVTETGHSTGRLLGSGPCMTASPPYGAERPRPMRSDVRHLLSAGIIASSRHTKMALHSAYSDTHRFPRTSPRTPAIKSPPVPVSQMKPFAPPRRPVPPVTRSN
jgi:hypothetical protein